MLDPSFPISVFKFKRWNLSDVIFSTPPSSNYTLLSLPLVLSSSSSTTVILSFPFLHSYLHLHRPSSTTVILSFPFLHSYLHLHRPSSTTVILSFPFLHSYLYLHCPFFNSCLATTPAGNIIFLHIFLSVFWFQKIYKDKRFLYMNIHTRTSKIV